MIGIELTEVFRVFLEAYGLNNTALYKDLLRDDVAGENRAAFDSGGIDAGRIDWSRFIRVPEYIFDSNACVFDTVVPLLNLFDDIKPFAHYAIRRERQKLEYLYDMDPAPLFNFDDGGYRIAVSIFEEFGGLPGYLKADPSRIYEKLSCDFAAILREIKENSLLGRNTGSYFAILRHWAHITYQELEAMSWPHGLVTAANLIGYMQVMKKLIQQLYDRCLCDSMGEGRKSRIRKALDGSLLLYVCMCVLNLLDGGYGVGAYRLSIGDAAVLMSDEVGGTVRGRFAEVFEQRPLHMLAGFRAFEIVKGALDPVSQIFLRYRFYREKFVYLGDVYGDCTANKYARQLNAEVTNIHWTVYSWLLNPYYRVLEVCSGKGDGLVKAHITPLLVHGRKVLMVDAIESVTKMRDELRGVPNKDFDRDFFESHNEEIFETLVDRCVSLGRRVGAEAVYADMYSNSTWINRALSKYPTDGYHISEVEQTFGGDRIADNARLIRESVGIVCKDCFADDAKVEIQAVNCNLMDQYTLRNHKEVAVLDGLRGDWKLGLRGI